MSLTFDHSNEVSVNSEEKTRKKLALQQGFKRELRRHLADALREAGGEEVP